MDAERNHPPLAARYLIKERKYITMYIVDQRHRTVPGVDHPHEIVRRLAVRDLYSRNDSLDGVMESNTNLLTSH